MVNYDSSHSIKPVIVLPFVYSSHRTSFSDKCEMSNKAGVVLYATSLLNLPVVSRRSSTEIFTLASLYTTAQ